MAHEKAEYCQRKYTIATNMEAFEEVNQRNWTSCKLTIDQHQYQQETSESRATKLSEI